MAMAFVLEHPAVTSAIIGPRTYEQLEDLLACADVRLDGGLLDRIDTLGAAGHEREPVRRDVAAGRLRKSARRRRERPTSAPAA